MESDRHFSPFPPNACPGGLCVRGCIPSWQPNGRLYRTRPILNPTLVVGLSWLVIVLLQFHCFCCCRKPAPAPLHPELLRTRGLWASEALDLRRRRQRCAFVAARESWSWSRGRFAPQSWAYFFAQLNPAAGLGLAQCRRQGDLGATQHHYVSNTLSCPHNSHQSLLLHSLASFIQVYRTAAADCATPQHRAR